MRSAVVMAARAGASSVTQQEAASALQARQHLRRHFGYLPIPIAFYLVFCGMALTHVPIDRMYPAETGLYSALVTTGTDAITTATTMKYVNIGSQSDVFSWLTDTFIPTTFVTTDYNGKNLTNADFFRRIQLFHSILGAVEFQTTSATLVACSGSGPLQTIYPHCHDVADVATEYFYLDAGTTATEATALVAAKQANGTWLSLATTKLDMTLATYDGELKIMNIVTYALSFGLGGYIHLESDIVAVPTDPYDGAGPIVLDVVVGLFFLGTLLAEVRRGRQRRLRDLVGFWHVIEWASLVAICVFYVLWAILCSYIYDGNFTILLTAVGASSASFNHGTNATSARANLTQLTGRIKLMGQIMTSVRVVAMVVMLLLVARILRAMRFHPNLNVLTSTLARSLSLFGPLFCVYAVCVAGFVSAGHILFGERLHAFSTLGYTLVTVINLSFGQFDFASIADINYYVALFYYWSTLIVLFLVLFNLMLAIVLKSYDQVTETHAANRSVLAEMSVLARHAVGRDVTAALHGKLQSTKASWSAKDVATDLGISEARARRAIRDVKTLAQVQRAPETTAVESDSVVARLETKIDRLEATMAQLLTQLQATRPSTPADVDV
ncbi:hypothetical protein SPRG_05130 [Saprolegnia parasitica CBS 223.65]|uniref:Polycystin cation channel PKD1/PKD2 domain-containing protein n=1 Tax=Saprolegnia parasitica (strain CBS 223.65) TaxID=695850 RepID=A0A067CL47_SAPPC|nr:hypothetical protein SPRG_05130 [Saprolegnia parasitica CBS 223.65]KDO29940.1 hypothetical protein SPRG_05130 [Saprolegnia parasitica CBS 223.65]|eukprot:XP_012199124.1 hypothetical protein SPRG_05130 [Saprolegnia parasitica CBS 223.65]